jgi:hypothetical protein
MQNIKMNSLTIPKIEIISDELPKDTPVLIRQNAYDMSNSIKIFKEDDTIQVKEDKIITHSQTENGQTYLHANKVTKELIQSMIDDNTKLFMEKLLKLDLLIKSITENIAKLSREIKKK